MTAATVDTIIRTLTPVEQEERTKRQLRARDIHTGRHVIVWGLAGRWAVVARGPEGSTWWLQPRDGDAVDVYRALAEKPSRGVPVVRDVANGCLVVHTSNLGAWSMVPLW